MCLSKGDVLTQVRGVGPPVGPNVLGTKEKDEQERSKWENKGWR